MENILASPLEITCTDCHGLEKLIDATEPEGELRCAVCYGSGFTPTVIGVPILGLPSRRPANTPKPSSASKRAQIEEAQHCHEEARVLGFTRRVHSSSAAAGSAGLVLIL